jgi:glycogen debranching enzyme
MNLDELSLSPEPGAASATLSASPAVAELSPPPPAHRLFVLKHANSFLVSDALGDIHGNSDGLFHDDTRLLSALRMSLGGQAPSALGARITADNVLFIADLSNRANPLTGLEEGVIHLERSRLLWQGVLHERLRFTNYADRAITLPARLRYDADFRDMFEVRGSRRERRGAILPALLGTDQVTLRYHGLDGLARSCRIGFSQPPALLTADHADLAIQLAPRGSAELYLAIGAEESGPASRAGFRHAAAQARRAAREASRRGAAIRTSAAGFNGWIERSRADLALLTTALPTGPYPYAGIPWFSTPFGRDAIITALQTLWLDPALARGVLAFLAEKQATEISSFRDAAPGKILHETRRGEMAKLSELPFAEYYGSVDTTPLFVLLAAAYARRSNDDAFIEAIWPALTAAIGWIMRECASHEDGFLHYARGAETGLANQGWKDSHDSVFHEDGRLATGPIALVEVQGYVFAALGGMAELAEARGLTAEAAAHRQAAEALRERVESRFWMEDLGTYAIAVDGAGAPCRVRSSNAGQLLFSGLPTPERAARVAAQLMAPDSCSGWGIRTIARGAARYNPMSYHNGSIWPHDTAMCIAGLARYGLHQQVQRLSTDLFEAAQHFDMRLPELFCGFARSGGEAPVAYPVACLPQAWAAGCVFMVIQSCLGVEIDGAGVHVRHPALPAGIQELVVSRLAIGGANAELVVRRTPSGVVAALSGAPGITLA